jgi:hypothetical protein
LVPRISLALIIALLAVSCRRDTAPLGAAVGHRSPALLATFERDSLADILTPIAMIADTGFAPPDSAHDEDAELAEAQRSYFATGRHYGVRDSTGHWADWIADSAEIGSCVGAIGIGRLEARAAVGRTALAVGDTTLVRRSSTVRPLTTPERERLTAYFTRIYQDSGVAQRRRGTIDSIIGAAIPVSNSNEFLTASIGIDLDDTAETRSSVVVIVDPDPAASIVVIRPHRGPDSLDDAREDYAGTIWLARDSTPLIITSLGYYESDTYAIYAKRHRQWSEVYRGGGGGC